MFGFFLASSVLNRFLISPVSRAAAEHERREGDFRFRHLAARTEAEGIGFSKSEKVSSVISHNIIAWVYLNVKKNL